MLFEAKYPGFGILVKTPFAQIDVHENHLEWKELNPRGFRVDFKVIEAPNGDQIFGYDTDRDRRLAGPKWQELKKEIEEALFEDSEIDPNFKVWEAPKQKMYSVEEVEKLKLEASKRKDDEDRIRKLEAELEKERQKAKALGSSK